jgi:hypothetical protein
MIHTYQLNGLPLRTGDIICTNDGEVELLPGDFWRLLGRLVPGKVGHVAVYVGPGGSCVEAGARGVTRYEIPGETWDPPAMYEQRGRFQDRFYGVAYPLEGLGLSQAEEDHIRGDVAAFCLAQAEARRPYNINFLNPYTEEAFYCSQLPYLAYLRHGIDLNTGLGVPNLIGTEGIVFPQEIWSGCVTRRSEI